MKVLSPTYAWASLVLITCLIWILYWIVDQYVFVLAVVLSMLKVGLIGFSFMDIHHAKKEVLVIYFAWVFASGLLFIVSGLIV